MSAASSPGRLEDLPDPALAELLVAGDAAALDVLYGRYGARCYALARRILTDGSLAQDVVQEVFLSLWRDPSRFSEDRGAFSSWLLAMTHHKAVDAVRREENLRRRREAAEVVQEAQSSPSAVHDQAWSTLRREEVRAALADLTETQREALVLAYFGGYTQREIAGLLGVPLGTVKTRMLAGMRRLRGRLAEWGDDPALDRGEASR